ncbi:hypothetical protein NQ315_010762 [Exocentrus adspersus]|uniref:Uncharacterized protein n=1 Tax=Exocentrus adspersus TaxID=1586481 RepID=A0AAV8VV05_9CUCU|nr:hypothetical protein NQ315_010762 [Exocentrus adspersus]
MENYLLVMGNKTQLKVDNLEPCTCYFFRIQLEPEGNWTHFKAATLDAGPYTLVLHMSRAVKLGKMPLIRKIAHYKPHLLETENKENKTPLVQAIETGDVQVLQLLINLGANVNTSLFYNKRTPLMIAVYIGKLQMASILVDKGAVTTATDVNGLNVLHYAVDSGSIENVKFALNLGLDVNCKDNKQWTPLLRAVILNISEEIINLLLANGADVKNKDKNGFNFETHRYIASLYQTSRKLIK